jgi:hypothetical protein
MRRRRLSSDLVEIGGLGQPGRAGRVDEEALVLGRQARAFDGRELGSVSMNQPFRKMTRSSSKPQGSEVVLHVFQGHGQLFPSVMRVAGIRRVAVLVRLRQAGEGVRDEHGAARIGVGVQNAAHVDAGAPAPDPRFEEIAGDPVLENLFRQDPDVSHPHGADHRLCERRPISADLPDLGIVGGGRQRRDRRISVETTRRCAFQGSRYFWRSSTLRPARSAPPARRLCRTLLKSADIRDEAPSNREYD